MARLLSVSVGLPRDIEWRGRTVHTAIWKEPVQGRRLVRRLNVEGDGQGDLGGHGGEQRAVFVYQIESYRYWEEQLGRRPLSHGQFGENFTIEGLPDDEVCIGDTLRIGTALFEVTQPRTTCFRVGIRMDEPRMAALLTSSGRPGFYLRVLEEGEVGAGDPISLVGRGPERMTVSTVNALLYSSHHPREQLERVLRIPALSPGWRWSFEALLRSQDAHPGATGNAGLVPASALQTAVPGFRQLRASRIDRETPDVISLTLEPTDGRPLTTPLAGQFVVLRLRPKPEGPLLFRSYSLSGPVSAEHYRISVKVEPNGAGGAYLADQVRVGDVLDVSEPRGSFHLQSGERPVVLLSGGIGATPVLAMLHALAGSASPREIWWLHGARNGRSHAFDTEVRRLLGSLARGRSHVGYSGPDATAGGRDFDAAGHLALRPRTLGVRRTGTSICAGRRGSSRPHGGPHHVGRVPLPDPFGELRRWPLADTRRGRWTARAPHQPAGVPGRTRGLVRTQRSRGSMAPIRGPEPSRAGRGLRRPGPMVVPHGRVSQLRERVGVRGSRLSAGSARSAGGRQRPHLLRSARGDVVVDI